MDKETEQKLMYSIKFAQANARGCRESIIFGIIAAVAGAVLFAVLLQNYIFIPVYAVLLIYFILRWRKLEKQYNIVIEEMEKSLKRKVVKLSDTAASLFSGRYADLHVFLMGIAMMGVSSVAAIILGTMLLQRANQSDGIHYGIFVGGTVVIILGSILVMPLINWIMLAYNSSRYNAILRADGIVDEAAQVPAQGAEPDNRNNGRNTVQLTEKEQQAASIRRFGFGEGMKKRDD